MANYFEKDRRKLFRLAMKVLDKPKLLNKRFYKNDYPTGVKRTLINHYSSAVDIDAVSIRIIIQLLDAGADPNLENPLYRITLSSTYFEADDLVKIRLCKVLLAYGADPNQETGMSFEYTCSMLGSFCRMESIHVPSLVKLLLDAGADVGCSCFIHMGKFRPLPHTIAYPGESGYEWEVEYSCLLTVLVEANF